MRNRGAYKNTAAYWNWAAYLNGALIRIGALIDKNTFVGNAYWKKCDESNRYGMEEI